MKIKTYESLKSLINITDELDFFKYEKILKRLQKDSILSYYDSFELLNMMFKKIKKDDKKKYII